MQQITIKEKKAVTQLRILYTHVQQSFQFHNIQELFIRHNYKVINSDKGLFRTV